VAQAADELRAGLSTAYREVRELIAAFRVRMGPGGLLVAVREAVDEFSQRSALEISFDADMGRCHLQVNEEFHVLQVIREALSNAVQHARAQRVWIHLRYGPTHQLRATIEDDGRGLVEPDDDDVHYGLGIMRERAGTLAGEVRIGPRPGGGTRVCLSFAPERVPTDVSDAAPTSEIPG
jgi:two-component system nitrate/nitrite sensor histidine kinase NarX